MAVVSKGVTNRNRPRHSIMDNPDIAVVSGKVVSHLKYRHSITDDLDIIVVNRTGCLPSEIQT